MPAPGRWRRAAACRRTAPMDRAPRSRQADELEQLVRPRAAPRVPAGSSSGSMTSARTARHSRARPAGRRSRFLVAPRLRRRLAVHLDRPGGRRLESPTSRSSVDLPQPDGPISETSSPWGDVEVDAGQRRHLALAAGIEHLVDGRDGDRLVASCRLPGGRPRMRTRSRTSMSPTKRMPSTPAAMTAQ